MGFLNPGLLWFALGGAVPVIIHLLHRQKFRRVRWAAMEFLLNALRKTQRRMRVENLILLLVRILVMILLAMAVARPFFHETPLDALGDSDTHHIFVVDVSYSMGYKRGNSTVLDEARKASIDLLEGLRPSPMDRFSLVTLSSYPEVPFKERNRREQIRAGLQELKPSHYGTSVAATLQEIRPLLESSKSREKRVYLFTDLQRSGWEFRDEQEAGRFGDTLKGLSKREDTRFVIYDLGVRDPVNRAVVGLRVDGRVVTTRRTARLHADIHNYSPVPLPQVAATLYVDKNAAGTKPVALPPNTTTPVSFEVRFTESGPHVLRVALDSDYLDVDDGRTLAVEVKPALRGLVVDGEPKDSPKESETYAFTLALDPTREGLYFSVDVKTVELFSAEGLEGYDFLVLANVPGLTSDKVERIEQFVQRGGGLLVSLGPRVDRVTFNREFWKDGQGLSPAALEDTAGSAPEGLLERGIERRIGRFAVDHPIFRTFREKLRAAIYHLVFYKYFKVAAPPPERVLASFDDDASSPVFLEKHHGEGKVVLFTSTLDHEWNAGIPGHPPYLPLMWSLCEHLATRSAGRRNLFVGDLLQIDLSAELYQPPFLLETPLEGVVTLSASAPEKDQKFFRLFYPSRAKTDDPNVRINEGLRHAGTYVLTRTTPKEEDRRLAYFAANVPPRAATPEETHASESNLDRITKEDIQRAYPDFRVEFRGEGKGSEPAAGQGKPPGGEAWKLLLYVLLGFLMMESVLAWLFGRAKQ